MSNLRLILAPCFAEVLAVGAMLGRSEEDAGRAAWGLS
jgi:hypothetical protein